MMIQSPRLEFGPYAARTTVPAFTCDTPLFEDEHQPILVKSCTMWNMGSMLALQDLTDFSEMTFVAPKPSESFRPIARNLVGYHDVIAEQATRFLRDFTDMLNRLVTPHERKILSQYGGYLLHKLIQGTGDL